MRHQFISNTYKYKTQVTWTPDMSAFYLENYNKRNVRPLDKNEAQKRLAGAIDRGEWVSDAALPICFTIDGQMGDGQTRAWACMKAGKPMIVDVAYGMSHKAIALRDTQRVRSIGASWAAAEGLGQEQAYRFARAVGPTRLWMRYSHNWADMRFSRQEMLAFYKRHQKHLDPMLVICSNKFANRAGFRAACAFYHTINPEKANKLFEGVSSYSIYHFYNNSDSDATRHTNAIFRLSDSLQNSQGTHAQQRLKDDFTSALYWCYVYETGKSPCSGTHLERWPA